MPPARPAHARRGRSYGEHYCFKKAVQVVAAASKGSKGEGGFVDVWKRGCFGWEYKRPPSWMVHQRSRP